MRISPLYQKRSNLKFLRYLPAVLSVIVIGTALVRPSPSCQQPEMTAAATPDSSPATTSATIPAATQPISTGVLEKDYGLQILHIAVTAAGGMVDFRFKILDPEKARQFFKNPHQMPTLVADDSGLTLIAPHHMAGNVRLQKDTVGFILYPNVRNAIKAGSPVSAVFGGVRVEPVKAQ
jgi:hypothetical protein